MTLPCSIRHWHPHLIRHARPRKRVVAARRVWHGGFWHIRQGDQHHAVRSHADFTCRGEAAQETPLLCRRLVASPGAVHPPLFARAVCVARACKPYSSTRWGEWPPRCSQPARLRCRDAAGRRRRAVSGHHAEAEAREQQRRPARYAARQTCGHWTLPVCADTTQPLTSISMARGSLHLPRPIPNQSRQR